MAFSTSRLLFSMLFLLAILVIFCANKSETTNSVFWNKQLLIKTSNGFVYGKQLRTVRGGKIFYSFRGIPFAERPIGNRRFADPEPVSDWKGVLDATEEKPICAQSGTSVGSEDCLYLNVYTTLLPHQNNTKYLLPVMIWIHGGGFSHGSVSYDNHKPDYLLDEGVVYVSVQYRLGPLGFLSTGDDVIRGNFGLKDQVVAVKWIHKNAAAFGGDPKKITLFGESAGGASVSYLTQTPQLYGLLRGAILQSGSSLAQWGFQKNPKEVAVQYARSFGINTRNSTEMLRDLREVPVNELKEHAPVGKDQIVFSSLLEYLPFAPVIEPDYESAVITERTYLVLQTGRFNRIPHVIGFNSEEAKTMAASSHFHDLHPSYLVPPDMNADEDKLAEIGRKIQAHYSTSPSDVYNKIRYLSDNTFVRPAHEHVKLISPYVPTYLYEFDYEGDLGSSNGNVPGAGHYEEVLYLFGTASRREPSRRDLKVRLGLVKLWTNFAKYRNPTPNHDELFDRVIWYPYSTNYTVYLSINARFANGINPRKGDMKFWDDLYEKYGKQPYSTY